MDISFAAIADLANVDGGGKLNILGIFSQMNPPKLPYEHPMLFLVLKLEVPRSEFGIERSVDVVLMDDDGTEIVRLGPVKVVVHKEQVKRENYVDVPIIFQINNLKLPKGGVYGWHINVDNDHKRTLPLQVYPQGS